MPSLEGVFKKINRSLEHLAALNQKAEAFFNEHGDGFYAVHGETNSQRTKQLFRCKLLVDLPLLEWGIVVGDAVHCLRSSLDQLAYTLSLDPDSNTQFPICMRPKEWATQAPPMLWGIPPPLVAAIDQSQPYHLGDDGHSHPLAVLRTLSNTDKHRHIPVTAIVPSDAEFEIVSATGVARYGDVRLKPGRVFEDNVVFAELNIVPADDESEPRVQMNGNLTFRVAFGKSGVPSSLVGKPVFDAFKGLGEAVQQVIVDIANAAGRWTESHRTQPDPAD